MAAGTGRHSLAGGFSLWFVLDPQPQASGGVRTGKTPASSTRKLPGYFAKLLWGCRASGCWCSVIRLTPVCWLSPSWFDDRALRQRRDNEKMLWIWLLVMLLVFSLPSQRSSRYLLAAMPALAVLCALGWQRIGRWWFVLTLIFAAVVTVGLAYLSYRLQALPAVDLYPAWYWLLLALTLVFAVFAMLRPALTLRRRHRPAGLPFAAAFLRPFDGALGNYWKHSAAWLALRCGCPRPCIRAVSLVAWRHDQGYREERQPIWPVAQHYRCSPRVPPGTAACRLPGCWANGWIYAAKQSG
jgi:hypothetical protein